MSTIKDNKCLISIVLCCRMKGNVNSSLDFFLKSLEHYAYNCDNFEVLIRFDDDDTNFQKYIKDFDHYPFAVKYCVGKRNGGYSDLHRGYWEAFQLASPTSIVVGAMADDFEIMADQWDTKILECCEKYPDNIFILHNRPHPRQLGYYTKGKGESEFKSTILPRTTPLCEDNEFFLDWNVKDLENLYIVDEFPLWSRKIINLTQGFGPVSFTDAWTLTLQHRLWHHHQINRTVFIKNRIAYRKTNPNIDSIDHERWESVRAPNFRYIRSNEYETLINHQAQLIAKEVEQ